jgi:hypothetical protein
MSTLKEQEREARKAQLKDWSRTLVENQVEISRLQAENKKLRADISDYMNDHQVKKFEKVNGTHQLIMTPRKKAPTMNQDFFEDTFDEYRKDVSKRVEKKLKSDERVVQMAPQNRQQCLAIVEDVVAQVLDQETVGKYIVDRKAKLTTSTKSLTLRKHGTGGRKRKKRDDDEEVEQEMPLPKAPVTRSRGPANDFQKPMVI